jgi:antitoxin ParD1/3/4
MPTRNVVLTDHQEQLIEKLVGSGRYQNASEILRKGLRLIEQREAEDAAKLKILRKAAAAGFDALDRGELREFKNMADLQAYLSAIAARIGTGHDQIDLQRHPRFPPGETRND